MLPPPPNFPAESQDSNAEKTSWVTCKAQSEFSSTLALHSFRRRYAHADVLYRACHIRLYKCDVIRAAFNRRKSKASNSATNASAVHSQSSGRECWAPFSGLCNAVRSAVVFCAHPSASLWSCSSGIHSDKTRPELGALRPAHCLAQNLEKRGGGKGDLLQSREATSPHQHQHAEADASSPVFMF